MSRGTPLHETHCPLEGRRTVRRLYGLYGFRVLRVGLGSSYCTTVGRPVGFLALTERRVRLFMGRGGVTGCIWGSTVGCRVHRAATPVQPSRCVQQGGTAPSHARRGRAQRSGAPGCQHASPDSREVRRAAARMAGHPACFPARRSGYTVHSGRAKHPTNTCGAHAGPQATRMQEAHTLRTHHTHHRIEKHRIAP